jgi:hypothetical protein
MDTRKNWLIITAFGPEAVAQGPFYVNVHRVQANDCMTLKPSAVPVYLSLVPAG